MTRRRTAVRRAVLGIDAAWTAAAPSGVALAVEDARGWRCAGVAPGYAAFAALAAGGAVDWGAAAVDGGEADAGATLEAAARLAPGAELRVVAVDMPLARGGIAGRRACDDAVTRAFGARGCGTHTPSARRPGPIAGRLRRAFEARGFGLATATSSAAPTPSPTGARGSLLEVYPHPALLALLASPYRLPYKASRARRYWPEADPEERRARLLSEWRRILGALRARIAGADLPLPATPPAAGRMKRLEDALDALVCAWIGIEFLEGRAAAYGDRGAAIWIPR